MTNERIEALARGLLIHLLVPLSKESMALACMVIGNAVEEAEAEDAAVVDAEAVSARTLYEDEEVGSAVEVALGVAADAIRARSSMDRSPNSPETEGPNAKKAG